jgi:DNA-binding response regulator vicR
MERPLILIVDDESKIRRLLAQNLELEGFDVQTASDGAQALEVYHKSVEKPDLILLDLMLPEIDGMTMLKRLRKSSDVPVIILSAKDERPTVIEGFREGADVLSPSLST